MFRRRKIFKRKGFFRKTRQTFKRFVRRVKKATTAIAEKKYRDFGINATVGINGLLIPITNAIPSGVNVGERIGNKIRVRYFTWRLSLFSNNEDVLYIRIALLRGRTAGLAIGDLPFGSGALTTYIDIEKWEVLNDSVFNLGDSDTDGKNKRFYKGVKKIFKDVTFDNASTGTGTVNPYYLYIWTNDVLLTGPNVIGNFRTTYVDI